MLTTSMIVAYACLIPLLSGLLLTNRISSKQCAGWMAILSASAGVLSAVNGWTSNVYVHAVVTAWLSWLWWHSGGGDDTKRRLRSWACRFQGVRRTAPSHA